MTSRLFVEFKNFKSGLYIIISNEKQLRFMITWNIFVCIAYDGRDPLTSK